SKVQSVLKDIFVNEYLNVHEEQRDESLNRLDSGRLEKYTGQIAQAFGYKGTVGRFINEYVYGKKGASLDESAPLALALRAKVAANTAEKTPDYELPGGMGDVVGLGREMLARHALEN